MAAQAVLIARAQHPDGTRRIIILMDNAENDRNGKVYTGAFRQSLEGTRLDRGPEIQIEYRWAAGDPDRASAYAKEVATLNPDAVLANGAQVLTALQQTTRSIPIVSLCAAHVRFRG